jgi:hypothetical protein
MSIDSIRSDSPPPPPPPPPNSPEIPEKRGNSTTYFLLFMLFELTAINMKLWNVTKEDEQNNPAIAVIATLGLVFLAVGCNRD